MNKKGTSLNDMYPAILTIILIGILLGIGIYTLSAVQEGTSTTTLHSTNETLAVTSASIGTVALSTDCGFHDMTILWIRNATIGNGSTIPTDLYTANADEGTITFTGVHNSSNVNVNYSYLGTEDTATTSSCGAIDTSITGVGGMASWIAVIVVVIAAAVVLGIVISSFGSRTRGV